MEIEEKIEAAPDDIRTGEDVMRLCNMAWARGNKPMLDRTRYSDEIAKVYNAVLRDSGTEYIVQRRKLEEAVERLNQLAFIQALQNEDSTIPDPSNSETNALYIERDITALGKINKDAISKQTASGKVVSKKAASKKRVSVGGSETHRKKAKTDVHAMEVELDVTLFCV